MKIAILSNVNLDPVTRMLKGEDGLEFFENQGYGNELAMLLNDVSALYSFKPETVFIIMDLSEVIGNDPVLGLAKENISHWFESLESGLKKNIVYYISDVFLRGEYAQATGDKTIREELSHFWLTKLRYLREKYPSIRIFPYRELVEDVGAKNAFSSKMWYMGKIPHSPEFHNLLAKKIKHYLQIETYTPKKVLLLDLDNTLWRGLAGEHDHTPIVLSDDGIGLAYKNFQRVIREMRRQGVIIGIVSKNNAKDALDIIDKHPHMILRAGDFVAQRINWQSKDENIIEVARELNLGLDSLVFIDDNPAERALVKASLPEVTVPEFPARPEELPEFMLDVYQNYFERAIITAEDEEKTAQYLANRARNEMKEKSVDFGGYLESLEMKLIRENPQVNSQRLLQLMNKTNQFNLTTRRFSEQQLTSVLDDERKEIFFYRVTDKFGDNGLTVAAIVEYGERAEITDFVMSCRIMGRQIENAVLEDMERAAVSNGYREIYGLYLPTEKNGPVKNLYPSLGYEICPRQEKGEVEYCLSLTNAPLRKYHLKRVNKEEHHG